MQLVAPTVNFIEINSTLETNLLQDISGKYNLCKLLRSRSGAKMVNATFAWLFTPLWHLPSLPQIYFSVLIYIFTTYNLRVSMDRVKRKTSNCFKI